MRFSAIIVGAFAALTVAQSTSSASATTVTTASATQSLTPEQSKQAECLGKCDAADVNCRAACLGVPYPNDGQVNSTTACVGECVKNFGNGTEADNLRFAACRDDCVAKNYWSISGGTPNPTGASGGSSGSGSGSATTTGATGAATGSSASGSSTGAAAPSGTNTGAADALRIGTSVAGAVAFLAAFVAM